MPLASFARLTDRGSSPSPTKSPADAAIAVDQWTPMPRQRPTCRQQATSGNRTNGRLPSWAAPSISQRAALDPARGARRAASGWRRRPAPRRRRSASTDEVVEPIDEPGIGQPRQPAWGLVVNSTSRAGAPAPEIHDCRAIMVRVAAVKVFEVNKVRALRLAASLMPIDAGLEQLRRSVNTADARSITSTTADRAERQGSRRRCRYSRDGSLVRAALRSVTRRRRDRSRTATPLMSPYLLAGRHRGR